MQTRFNDWITSRIRDFLFTEGEDFETFTENQVKGRPTTEYAITLNMAKELAMAADAPIELECAARSWK